MPAARKPDYIIPIDSYFREIYEAALAKDEQAIATAVNEARAKLADVVDDVSEATSSLEASDWDAFRELSGGAEEPDEGRRPARVVPRGEVEAARTLAMLRMQAQDSLPDSAVGDQRIGSQLGVLSLGKKGTVPVFEGPGSAVFMSEAAREAGELTIMGTTYLLKHDPGISGYARIDALGAYEFLELTENHGVLQAVWAAK